MRNSWFRYEPYFSRPENKEIPCYQIYWEGDPIAETNMNMPRIVQMQAAHYMAYSREFFEGLRRAVKTLKSIHVISIEGMTCNELAKELEMILALGSDEDETDAE